jgi:hypothetical protein
MILEVPKQHSRPARFHGGLSSARMAREPSWTCWSCAGHYGGYANGKCGVNRQVQEVLQLDSGNKVLK